MPSAGQYRQLINESPTLRAFLNLIGWAEGADYNIGWGGRIIPDLSRHPYRQREFTIIDPVTKRPSTTSVAGKYQFQRGTWDTLARRMGLRDFSPASQDIAAVALIDENGALPDVLNGNIGAAVLKLKPIWQSFITRNYNSILGKYNEIASGSKYNIPMVSPTAQPVSAVDDFSKYMGIEVFGAKNRYLIAFAILVIIFIFAFN